jgi:uncharacterized protein
MWMDREVRYFQPDKLEVRSDEDKRGLAGYAAVYDKDSELLYGSFIERIAKGAFTRTLKSGRDVKAFWSHNDSMVLGSTRAGTLRLKEDDVGLAFDLDMPDTSWGKDAFETVRRGDVSGVSFGFDTVTDKWETKNGKQLRTLVDLELYEISPCAIPAYPDTSVGLRSLAEAQKQLAHNNNDMLRRRLELKERTIV